MPQSPEVIAAWVAVGGVIISWALSWFTARRTAEVELRKQRLQFFQAYAERLQEQRLAVYPTAYSLLSECAKQLHRGTITSEYLANALKQFQEWDSAHSLLLSQRAANVLFHGQWELHTLLEHKIPATTLEQEQFRQRLIDRIEAMELVLKEDIGVFAVEYEDDRKLRSYHDRYGNAKAKQRKS